MPHSENIVESGSLSLPIRLGVRNRLKLKIVEISIVNSVQVVTLLMSKMMDGVSWCLCVNFSKISGGTQFRKIVVKIVKYEIF